MAHHNIKVKLSNIAALLDGFLQGEDIEITGFSTPENQENGSICIISSKQYIQYIKDGKSSAYIVAEGLNIETDKPLVIVQDTRYALVKILSYIYPAEQVKEYVSKFAAIDESAVIENPCHIDNFVSVGKNVHIGKNTKIYPNVVIGDNVTIGENCIIYGNVTLYENVTVGNNVIIHAGTVIGADGFGFIPGENPVKIPQKGTVILHDFVEVGANACIDRATIGSTEIGFGTKLDDLVMVGHNTHLGKACLIASQVGFSGSIKAGDFIVAGGQVGFADHITIASGSMFGGQSGVPGSIDKKGMYLGSPCMEFGKFAKSHAVFQELPALKRRVKDLGK
ncbi:MAG: UDP-3-O-(3-hydroxymyristoyl)glucosamine N-acyltransferase [Mucispirillum sp.]|nr:UDP-3-O-(3-hydroxymyristoyl)glucosamine N-acyltransferase [Mucispirillum sp.]